MHSMCPCVMSTPCIPMQRMHLMRPMHTMCHMHPCAHTGLPPSWPLGLVLSLLCSSQEAWMEARGSWLAALAPSSTLGSGVEAGGEGSGWGVRIGGGGSGNRTHAHGVFMQPSAALRLLALVAWLRRRLGQGMQETAPMQQMAVAGPSAVLNPWPERPTEGAGEDGVSGAEQGAETVPPSMLVRSPFLCLCL